MSKYKALNAVSVVTVIAGVVFLLGAVGAMERDALTIGEALIRFGIAAGCMLVGLPIQAYLDKKYRA